MKRLICWITIPLLFTSCAAILPELVQVAEDAIVIEAEEIQECKAGV